MDAEEKIKLAMRMMRAHGMDDFHVQTVSTLIGDAVLDKVLDIVKEKARRIDEEIMRDIAQTMKGVHNA